jgi:glycosyltransferase involved in cell wall biosynthesis
MRILHLLPTLDRASGGPVEGVRQRGLVLRARGHEVEAASLDAPGSAALAGFPLPTHALGPGRGRYGWAPRLVPWLREHARTFDAVVINGMWQYHGFAARRALLPMGVPYVVFTHGMLDPWFRRRHPLKHLKKWLYWPWGEYRVLRDADAVLFTSEDERARARESFWLYRCREVVVPYGTAPPPPEAERQREAFLARFPALRGQRALLFLGRIHAKKGCDLLLRAFAACLAREQRLRLVLAGPDPDGIASRLVRELGVDEGRVAITGMLAGDEKWGAYRTCEAFVLPSHQENFAIAACEALACGLPVLISDQVNIWREVDAAGAGLVEHDDLAGTTRLLERWLALGDEDRRGMSQRALSAFSERYHVDRSADGLLAALDAVIARRRGGSAA